MNGIRSEHRGCRSQRRTQPAGSRGRPSGEEALMNQWEFAERRKVGRGFHAVDVFFRKAPLLPLVGWMEEGGMDAEAPAGSP